MSFFRSPFLYHLEQSVASATRATHCAINAPDDNGVQVVQKHFISDGAQCGFAHLWYKSPSQPGSRPSLVSAYGLMASNYGVGSRAPRASPMAGATLGATVAVPTVKNCRSIVRCTFGITWVPMPMPTPTGPPTNPVGAVAGAAALRGRTVRCAKSWLFSTTGSSVSSED